MHLLIQEAFVQHDKWVSYYIWSCDWNCEKSNKGEALFSKSKWQQIQVKFKSGKIHAVLLMRFKALSLLFIKLGTNQTKEPWDEFYSFCYYPKPLLLCEPQAFLKHTYDYDAHYLLYVPQTSFFFHYFHHRLQDLTQFAVDPLKRRLNTILLLP